MPCNDCSRTEKCPPCPHEEQEREVPLATPCECGHTRNFHLPGRRMLPCIITACDCGNFRAKPILRCKCGHRRIAHEGRAYRCGVERNGTCGCQVFVCDHSQCGWKPREDAHHFVDEKHCDACAKAWDDQLKGVRMVPRPEPESHNFVSPAHCADCSKLWGQCPKACSEGHTYSGSCMLRADGPEPPACSYGEHGFKPFQGFKDEPGKPHCLTCGHVWGACNWHWVKEDLEPPLTPEEEEKIAAKFRDADAEHLPPPEGPACTCGETACESQSCDCDSAPCPVDHAGEAPEDANKAICGSCYTDHSKGSCEPAKAPPQPERRPPYAVDYSAGGHAFQVLVPGDAAVLAVDGALIIRHADFPVLGISCITPLKTEAS